MHERLQFGDAVNYNELKSSLPNRDSLPWVEWQTGQYFEIGDPAIVEFRTQYQNFRDEVTLIRDGDTLTAFFDNIHETFYTINIDPSNRIQVSHQGILEYRSRDLKRIPEQPNPGGTGVAIPFARGVITNGLFYDAGPVTEDISSGQLYIKNKDGSATYTTRIMSSYLGNGNQIFPYGVGQFSVIGRVARFPVRDQIGIHQSLNPQYYPLDYYNPEQLRLNNPMLRQYSLTLRFEVWSRTFPNPAPAAPSFNIRYYAYNGPTMIQTATMDWTQLVSEPGHYIINTSFNSTQFPQDFFNDITDLYVCFENVNNQMDGYWIANPLVNCEVQVYTTDGAYDTTQIIVRDGAIVITGNNIDRAVEIPLIDQGNAKVVFYPSEIFDTLEPSMMEDNTLYFDTGPEIIRLQQARTEKDSKTSKEQKK